MNLLTQLAKFCAVLAGVLLTTITLITCASLIGRNTTGWTLVGDIELAAVAAGAAIALFLPWCQIKRGNILVDFFTNKCSAQTNLVLDRIGALLLGLAMLLVAWRTTIGSLNAYANSNSSMQLGFPDWIVYAAMVPPIVLTALIGLAQAATGKFETEEHIQKGEATC